MRRWTVVLLLVVPGIAVVVLCAMMMASDYAQLGLADQQFRHLTASGAPLRELFIAEARQNAHRMNVFAEGVWGLLGALLAGLGLHALVSSRRDGA